MNKIEVTSKSLWSSFEVKLIKSGFMIFQDVFSQYDVKNNKFECKWRLDKENVLGL